MTAFEDYVSKVLIENGLICSKEQIYGYNYFPPAAYKDFFCAVKCFPAIESGKFQIGDNIIVCAVIENGYINLNCNAEFLKDFLLDNLKSKGDMFGLTDEYKGLRFIVEHTSITPAYPINLATFRSSVIGNAIASVLRMCGAKTETHFWVEDTAIQLELLKKGAERVDKKTFELTKVDHTIGKIFTKEYSRLSGKKIDVDKMFPYSAPILKGTNNLNETELARLCVSGHVETLLKCDTVIEVFDFETEDKGVNFLELNYQDKNAIYFGKLAGLADRVISVVSARQQAVVNQSFVEKENQNKIQVVYFGDVFFSYYDEEVVDKVSAGIFNSVDDYLSKYSEKYSVDSSVIAAGLKYTMLSCGLNKRIFLRKSELELEFFIDIYSYLYDLKCGFPEKCGVLDQTIFKYLLLFEKICLDVKKTYCFEHMCAFVTKFGKYLMNTESVGLSREEAQLVLRIFNSAFQFLGINLKKLFDNSGEV